MVFIYSLSIQHTGFYLQTSLTLVGAGAGLGAPPVLPEAAGTCGPLRRPFNLLNMSINLKVHLQETKERHVTCAQ